MELEKFELDLYKKISALIETSRQKLKKEINYTMLFTYWHIGKMVKETILNNQRAQYGEEVVKRVSKMLVLNYGSGFGARNIRRMISVYEKFNDFEKVTTVSTQLSWSHFVELIKIDDEIKREFYVVMNYNEGWSTRTLRDKINSMLFERTAISSQPQEVIKADLNKLIYEKEMSTELFLKNSYLWDFLDLKENFSERDLESAILLELEKVILEFGNDFAFMARQKRIQVGGNDYYIDLLFYHRKLRRLVLLELKLGEFKPEHKGQVELYLKYLAKYEKQDFEEDPIAIILCSSKDDEVVELMDLGKDNIHISEYWLSLPPKDILMKKLHFAIEKAKERMVENSEN